MAHEMLECVFPTAAAVDAVEPAGATEGGGAGRLLGAVVLELSANGGGGWVAGADDGASRYEPKLSALLPRAGAAHGRGARARRVGVGAAVVRSSTRTATLPLRRRAARQR